MTTSNGFSTESKAAYGKVNVLVNNAGIYEFAPLESISAEHFHKHFNLNVLGLLLTTQEAVKLIGPTGGSIINMSSIAGKMPVQNTSVYSATKAAVDAITIALSQELGPGSMPAVWPKVTFVKYWNLRHHSGASPNPKTLPGPRYFSRQTMRVG